MPPKNIKLDITQLPDAGSTVLGVLTSLSGLWVSAVIGSAMIIGLMIGLFLYFAMSTEYSFNWKYGFRKRRHVRYSRRFRNG